MQQPEKNVAVTVTRAFWHKGKSHPVDSELVVDRMLAIELRSAGKVSFKEAAQRPGPLTTENAGSFVKGGPKKGDSNA